MRYSAFLSYSHLDEPVARWLLRRLEAYRVPSRLVGTRGRYGLIPARLGPVFRDRDELPTASDLGRTITDALNASEALVVVCSPGAARSRWVNAEIAAFRAAGHSERVYCLVVDGDPGQRDGEQACFPPALLEPDLAGGAPREPLAADARRAGDGRERAFVRLVSGLLGLGYDDLAQREAQRRQRRLVVIAGASLAVTALALGLAAVAWVARNDAERRQVQAEDILGFMLGDLRKKLGTMGRLDLMRAVDDKATGYFATLDPRDLSDRALGEQARALIGIGEVRFNEGNHDAALAAFTEAHSRSSALYRRDPADGQRLFDLAQAEYWIGFVAFEQGRLEEAGRWFRRYRDSGARLAALDPASFAWQRELGYGLHNLAVLEDAAGRYAEAEQQMLAELDLYRLWVAQRPDDHLLRSDMSDVASWLGSLAQRQGRLEKAEAHFMEQNEVLRALVTEDPRNARWKEQRHDALLLLADAQAQRGRLAEARANVEAAASIGAALAAQDPSNNYWRLTSGRSRWWQALLAARMQPATAAAIAADATAQLGAARVAEPKSERVLAWHARSLMLEAGLALGRAELATAGRLTAEARTMIQAASRKAPSEVLRQRLAQALLLEGEVVARGGDAAGAERRWSEARQLLEADATAGLPFGRLDPLVRVLQHLGLGDAARPHLERLKRAGYVPIQPFPDARG